ADTTYSYRVRATRNGSNSAYTNIASVTTAPTAPTGLTALAISPTQIKLTWTIASTKQTGFKIQKSTDGVNFLPAGLAGQNATTFTVGGLNPATQYYFQ